MEENRKDQWKEEYFTGQKQNQDSQQNQGILNRDVNDTSINLEEKEYERDIYPEEEIIIPKKERNKIPPYTGKSSEQNQGYNQNSQADNDDDSVDIQNRRC